MCCSGLGIGVAVVPNWATSHLWLISDSAPTGIQMLQQSVSTHLVLVAHASHNCRSKGGQPPSQARHRFVPVHVLGLEDTLLVSVAVLRAWPEDAFRKPNISLLARSEIHLGSWICKKCREKKSYQPHAIKASSVRFCTL